MNRTMVRGIVFGSLLALGACAKTTAGIDDTPGFPVGDQIFPTVAAVTEYATWGTDRNGVAVHSGGAVELALTYGDKAIARARVETKAGLRATGVDRPLVRADGRPSIRPDLAPGAVDLLELLPPAGGHLALDQTYDTPSPDVDYILSEADQDRLVLWQPMIQQPTAMIPVGDKTLVRVVGRGVNRLHLVDDDGSIRSSDLGTAYLSVADLIHVPGNGWQVLRFARVSDVEGADQNPSMDLATARGRKHATFVVCSSRMDVAASDLAQLHSTLAGEVPEFAACATH
jgi:hypothetical protein